MTELALSNRSRGTVIPSALAVSRLTTSSNTVGRATGISPGLMPEASFTYVTPDAPKGGAQAFAVTHQATEIHEFPNAGKRGETVLFRQGDDFRAVREKEGLVRQHENAVCLLAHCSFEGHRQ